MRNFAQHSNFLRHKKACSLYKVSFHQEHLQSYFLQNNLLPLIKTMQIFMSLFLLVLCPKDCRSVKISLATAVKLSKRSDLIWTAVTRDDHFRFWTTITMASQKDLQKSRKLRQKQYIATMSFAAVSSRIIPSRLVETKKIKDNRVCRKYFYKTRNPCTAKYNF